MSITFGKIDKKEENNMNQEPTMTLGKLKKIVQQLSSQQLSDETKIFLDTGWDSLQEINPDSVKQVVAQTFQIQDPLTNEFYGGFVREEKSHTKEQVGEKETVLVIEQQY